MTSWQCYACCQSAALSPRRAARHRLPLLADERAPSSTPGDPRAGWGAGGRRQLLRQQGGIYDAAFIVTIGRYAEVQLVARRCALNRTEQGVAQVRCYFLDDLGSSRQPIRIRRIAADTRLPRARVRSSAEPAREALGILSFLGCPLLPGAAQLMAKAETSSPDFSPRGLNKGRVLGVNVCWNKHLRTPETRPYGNGV